MIDCTLFATARALNVALCAMLLLGCGRAQGPEPIAAASAQADGGSGSPAPTPGFDLFAHTQLVDLTHDFSADTIYWPTERPFELEVEHAGETPGGWYYAANRLHLAEHGGTHLDAPIHFVADGKTADQIPLERVFGPATVVDVGAAAKADRDYLASVSDLEAWEARHGRIPDGAIVLFRTGWGARWPDRVRYLGTDLRGPEGVAALHFPGIDPAAARWLVENRRIAAVGIDTASIDRGQSRDFLTHRILLGADVPAFENVDRLEALPERGAFVVALPMKIRGGSGGPARIVALVPYP